MDFRKNFIKNLLISSSYNYVSQGISFLSTIITSRILLPNDFGFVGLITVITGFLSILSDNGISYSIIRENYLRTYYRAIDSLSFLIGCILCVITSLLAFPLSLFYKNNDLILPTIVFSVIFLFRNLSSVRAAILSKKFAFETLGKVTFTTTTFTILFTILLAYLGAGYWSLIIPQIAASILQLILYEYKVQLGFNLFSIHMILIALKKTKKTFLHLSGFNIVNYWARNSDNLIVGKYFGAQSLGIYSRAYMLLTLPLTVITGIISNISLSMFTKIKDDHSLFEKEYFWVLNLITVLACPIAAILILFSQEIVTILWGSKWLAVSDFVPYFGLLIISQSLLSTAGNMLIIKNKEKVLMISGLLGSCIIIGAIILGSLYSVKAIAQFYSIAFISIVLPFNIYYLFIYSMNFNQKRILFFWLPIVFVSIAMWGAIYWNKKDLKIFVLVFLLILILNNIKTIIKDK